MTILRVTPRPWDQLPDESAPAYRAALAYFNQAPPRSIAAVQRGQSEGNPRATKNNVSGHLARWSVKFRWISRAAAFDENRLRIEQEAHETADKRTAVEKAELVRERYDAWTESLWEASLLVIDAVNWLTERQRANDRPTMAELMKLTILMVKAMPIGDRYFEIVRPGGVVIDEETDKNTSIDDLRRRFDRLRETSERHG